MSVYSDRESDIRREAKLHNLVDMIYKENGISFKRNEEVVLQKHGIDGIAKFGHADRIMFVDEKAAIKYWNKDILSFAFELFSDRIINRELVTTPGWFNTDNKFIKTTHYSLIWVRSEDYNFEHIQSIEICIVSKDDLWNYISCFGYDSNGLFESVKDEPEYWGISRKEITPDIRVVWSKNIIPERPVCVTVKKDVLIDLSIFHIKKEY